MDINEEASIETEKNVEAEAESENKNLAKAKKFITETEAELFTNSRGTAFITFKFEERKETMELGSPRFKKELSAIHIKKGMYISPLKQDEMVDILSALAFVGKVVKEPNHRVGNHEGHIIVDLGNPEGDFVVINNKDWFLRKEVPIPFEKSSRGLALPIPKKIELEKFLELFKGLFNFEDKDYFILVLAFLAKAMMKGYGSYPILVLDGAQGSGKTTMTNALMRLCSPCDPSLLSPPKNTDDVIVMSRKSSIMGFDNLSGLSAEMADVYCRVATGSGISKKKLYTDGDEASYKLLCPIIVNGIGEPSTRPDFIDRTITICLSKLDPLKRVGEMEVEEKFLAIYPYLTGGLYTLISQVIAILPGIPNKGCLQRMTEYHRVGIAVEKVFNLPKGFFTKTYCRNIDNAVDEIFAGDPLCGAIEACFERMKKHGHKFGPGKLEIVGKPTEIYERVIKDCKKGIFGIPRSPSAFTNKLGRLEVVLNSKGYYFEELQRESSKRGLRIWFDDPEEIVDL